MPKGICLQLPPRRCRTESGTRSRQLAKPRPEDICPRPEVKTDSTTHPHAPPIQLASVWQCENTRQANQLLEGEISGYVYQRDGHPNADMFASQCRLLHDAEQVAITSSGMAALATAVLSQLKQGDHLLVSNQLYGRSAQLLTTEASRLGIEHTVVDPHHPAGLDEAFQENSRMLVVETITNPQLRVADLADLAGQAHRHQALLLVDNTFATPALCRPLDFGADLVMESVSKMMNGHSDVMLGMLAGPEQLWDRVPQTVAAWGLASSPLDCWLALRGLGTLPLRLSRASTNALLVAQFLTGQQKSVETVQYPGLPNHQDHELAKKQFGDQFGFMVTFNLQGGQAAADAFIRAAERIPFCPSLGELSTTLSHPASTSHRKLSEQQQASVGISSSTIRLSVGIESSTYILESLEESFAGMANS